MFQHHPEKFFLGISSVKVLASAEYFTSLDEGRREKAYASTNNRLKFGYRPFFNRSYNQYRTVSGCLFVYVK
jgi:hypothetical protein